MGLLRRIATRLTAQRDQYDVETDDTDLVGDAMEDFAEKCPDCGADLELTEHGTQDKEPFYATECPECTAVRIVPFDHPKDLPWYNRKH